jgi:hypothetical protein
MCRTRLIVASLAWVLAACGSTPSPSPATLAAPPATQPIEAVLRPSVPPAAVDWTALARPYQFPQVEQGDACPRSSARTVTRALDLALGDGPVYPIGLPDGVLLVVAGGDNYLQKVLWVSSSSYLGPVLIRGARIDGPGSLQFAASGMSIWEPTDDMRLQKPTVSSSGEEVGWREWSSYTEVTGSGCYAYQVDGTSFSTVIVFEARLGD